MFSHSCSCSLTAVVVLSISHNFDKLDVVEQIKLAFEKTSRFFRTGRTYFSGSKLVEVVVEVVEVSFCIAFNFFFSKNFQEGEQEEKQEEEQDEEE